MELLFSIVALFFTFLGLFLSEKSRLIKIFDDIYTLTRELHKIRGEENDSKDMRKRHLQHERIADLQLQIKHLLIEVDNTKFVCLSLPQLRLLADTCEDFLYYNDAEKYWEKCLSKKFVSGNIRAEYYRRYAQFLYSINKEKEGCAAYRKSIELKNDNDGSIYINVQTYYSWIGSILNKINMPGYESYHRQGSSSDYYIPLVKKLLDEMYHLSGKIKDVNKQSSCYKDTEQLSEIYNNLSTEINKAIEIK